MPLLSIIILSSNRYDLLEATIHSLLATMTYPNWEMKIINHDGSIGEGWNRMIENIKGDYVLVCQDDWYFIERWDWAYLAINVLENNKDIGMFRLRKTGDGQVEEKVLEEFGLKSDGRGQFGTHCIVGCIGGGFSMNPFICRRELIEKLGKVNAIQRQKGVAELELRDRYNSLELKTAKLSNAARGVCIHIGRGRRILGQET